MGFTGFATPVQLPVQPIYPIYRIHLIYPIYTSGRTKQGPSKPRPRIPQPCLSTSIHCKRIASSSHLATTSAPRFPGTWPQAKGPRASREGGALRALYKGYRGGAGAAPGTRVTQHPTCTAYRNGLPRLSSTSCSPELEVGTTVSS